MSTRHVVVTGLGAFSPLGTDVESTWKAALAGTSSAHTYPEPWDEEYGLSVNFGCRVVGDPETILPRKTIKRTDLSGRYGLISAQEAWDDAGSPELDPVRLGVVFGTGIGGITTTVSQWDIVREKGARRVSPFTVPMLMPNSSSATIELHFGAQAGAHAPVSACASGAEAVIWAAKMIAEDEADVVISGGTEAAVHPFTMAAFANMRALSTRTDDPEHASRPYDVDRDGFVMGEGAGALILEEEEHARARGARIYAHLSGWGMSSDAYDIAAPTPDGSGPARAIRKALGSANLAASDIVHVNAHATSTPAGDLAEVHAIEKAFDGQTDQVTLTSTKSMTGHLLGGAGALESVFTVLALTDRVVPPTINIETVDPELSIPLANGATVPLAPTGDLAALNNAFGFGGHNATLAFTTSATA